MSLPPVYVISLAHRKDRRDKLRPQLAEQGINAIWVNAINGKELPFRYPFDKNGGYAGALGCHASHVSIWQTVKKESIILEDDCKLIGDLKAAYEQVKDRTEPLHFFGWSKYASKLYTQTEQGGIVKPLKSLALHCYLFRKNTKLINEALKFERLIDVITSEAGGTAHEPMIAVQEPCYSDITNKHANYLNVMR